VSQKSISILDQNEYLREEEPSQPIDAAEDEYLSNFLTVTNRDFIGGGSHDLISSNSPCTNSTHEERLNLANFALQYTRVHSSEKKINDCSSGETLSYDELVDNVGRVSAGLSTIGFNSGDILRIQSANSIRLGKLL